MHNLSKNKNHPPSPTVLQIFKKIRHFLFCYIWNCYIVKNIYIKELRLYACLLAIITNVRTNPMKKQKSSIKLANVKKLSIVSGQHILIIFHANYEIQSQILNPVCNFNHFY